MNLRTSPSRVREQRSIGSHAFPISTAAHPGDTLTAPSDSDAESAYPAGRFKAECLALMAEVARTGKPLIVTRHGKPMVRIVPAVPRTDFDEAAWRTKMRALSPGLRCSDDEFIAPLGEPWNAEQ